MKDESEVIVKSDIFEEAEDFLQAIFGKVLVENLGEIEIRGIYNGKIKVRNFHDSIESALVVAGRLSDELSHAYFGVNPRIGESGKKENVHYVTTIHVDVDCGSDGHKKENKYQLKDEALKGILQFIIKPSYVVDSGGGYHVYWILEEPIKVSDIGVETIENINKNLSLMLGGDAGTQNIDRILRVPGTYNYKEEYHNIKDGSYPQVKIVYASDNKYSLDDFDSYKEVIEDEKPKPISTPVETLVSIDDNVDKLNVNNLPIPLKIKNIIFSGAKGKYQSRSEADFIAVLSIHNAGVEYPAIRKIYENYPIGEKYREQHDREQYLRHTYKKAVQNSDLTNEDLKNPLITNGALFKDKSKFKLNMVYFADYIIRKYHLKLYNNILYQFNGKYYEDFKINTLNQLCQDELGEHRNLFNRNKLKEAEHFILGKPGITISEQEKNNVDYLTFENCLFSVVAMEQLEHTPDKFTVNLLPYDYDPSADCKRWKQFLDEIFENDEDKILFMQEAIGYGLYTTLNKAPGLYFLVGNGCNGKSVLLNTMADMFGEENVSNISISQLSDEKYIIELNDMMINISSETPHKKKFQTDLLKASVDSDWIIGRSVFKYPMKFRPHAKHFFAMNKLPEIDDDSHGMWRRINVIEFPRTFTDEDMDVDLADKLKEELPGIFNWALVGLNRLKSNNFRFTKSDSIEKANRRYRKRNSSVQSFIEDKIIPLSDQKFSLKLSILYSEYLEYCNTEGYQVKEKKKDFMETLRSKKFKVVKSKTNDNQYYVSN